jgi:phosphoribosylaminoimidazole-succinocarboxamide synthase
LETSGWDKQAPAPRVPQDILQKTADKYTEAQQRLTSL